MQNHQAPEQMIGYLYQVRYALFLLLDDDSDDMQISIERFDDIAFSQNDTPKQLIQLKHHVKRHGNLTDSSTDLWRTLKVWIDTVSSKTVLLSITKFLIITTASAPEGEATSFLRNTGRNPELAYKKLKEICEKSKNEAHREFYKAFSCTSEDTLKRLIDNIWIIDNASSIVEVEKKFRQKIRYSCLPKYEDPICERLEGWWYKKAIEALCSDEPVFISQNQVRSLIVAISQEYSDENLPIDIWDIEDIEESDLAPDERVFCEQLKLICVSSSRIRIALRDYYRAFVQRANWVRNDLLFVNELENYEQRLIDEWEHCFAAMLDNLNNANNSRREMNKENAGRILFSEIENKDIRIRPKCKEAFVMRGSYHILANQLRIGWHIDFYNRLKHLLHSSKERCTR